MFLLYNYDVLGGIMVIEILIKVFTLNFITYYISQKILKEDRIHYIKTIVVSILTTSIYMM